MSYFTLLNRLLPLVSYSPGQPLLDASLRSESGVFETLDASAGLVEGGVTPFYARSLLSDWERVWTLLLLKVRHTSNASSVCWPNWPRLVVSVFRTLLSWPVTLATSSQLMNRNLSGRELTAPVIASGLKTLSGSGASIFRTQERNPIAFVQAVQLQVSA